MARFVSGLLPAALVGFLFLAAVVGSSGVPVPLSIWASLPVTALLATLALAAIYYTLAALLKHGLIAGLVYTFVVETMITSVPGTMQQLSVMFHVRSLHHRLTDAAFTALASENPGRGRFSQAEPGEFLLQKASEVEYDTTPEAILILCAIAAVALAFGAWRIRRRDFALKD